MGIHPHALFSKLFDDLEGQLDPSSLDRIKGGSFDWPGISYRERAASSLISSFLKKLESGMTRETKQIALEKFLLSNSRCENWNLPDQYSTLDSMLLTEFRNLIHDFWYKNSLVDDKQVTVPLVDHPYDILEQGMIGPGSSLDADGTDFYTKFFSSRLVGTSSRLYFWYKRYIRSFPAWSSGESLRAIEHGEFDVVDSNRLDFVPKNDRESRSICVEPALNMCYQLGFGAILSRRLKNLWGIDLTVQQFLNRDLARKGSIDESFFTIDLSSASDSISRRMLDWALPPSFREWLTLLRCPTSKLPDGRSVELHMVSTMGNGYTFPLQTVLFSAAVLAAFKVHGLAPVYPTRVCSGSFGVNGDDIIAPTVLYSKVCRLLDLLGFTVNSAKSFAEGPFRESCGGDYFKGRNLRGVFVKRLRGPQDSYSVINALNLFSARTGLRLSKTVQTLLKSVRFQPVPLWANDDSGIRMPLSCVPRSWRKLDHNRSFCYKSWEPTPPPKIAILENALRVPKKFKGRSFNPPGLEVSLLQGSVNACTISLRPREVHYRWKLRVAPNWDVCSTYVGCTDQSLGYSLTIHSFREWLDGSRCETAIYLNLYG